MKHKSHIGALALSGLSAFILASSQASAALVSINTSTLSSTGTELISSGTLLFAWDVNGDTTPNPVVNGITFTDVQPGTISIASFPAIVNETPGGSTEVLYTGGMASIMGDYVGTNIASNGTVTLNGLTVGQQYRVQFLHHQNGAVGQRDMEVHFGTSAGTGGGAVNVGGTQGYITTAIFTADTATQQFTFRVGINDRAILNGATLFSVPEPSVALLGGLGVLALLRRRRM